MLIHIITPCGGSHADVDTTLASVERVVRQLPSLAVRLYRVLNNGLTASGAVTEDWSFEVVDLDINPLASPALARNAALDLIDEKLHDDAGDAGYVVFLDAGDILLPDLISDLMTGRVSGDVVVGASLIRTRHAEFFAVRLPLYFKHVINPVYLGSAITRTQVALAHRFIAGRKEDWKYWLAVLGDDPIVAKHHAPNYVYTVVGQRDHTARKSKLVGKQYSFYRSHLKRSVIGSVTMLCFHYITLILIWWVVQPGVNFFRSKVQADDR